MVPKSFRRRRKLSAAATAAATSTLLAFAPTATESLVRVNLAGPSTATHALAWRASKNCSLRTAGSLGGLEKYGVIQVVTSMNYFSGLDHSSSRKNAAMGCRQREGLRNKSLGNWIDSAGRRAHASATSLTLLQAASKDNSRNQKPGSSSSSRTSRKSFGTGPDSRNAPDLPALVVGMGFLVARHRRQQRADNERQQLLARGMRVSNGEEDVVETAAQVGSVGAGLASRRNVGRRNGAYATASGEDDTEDDSDGMRTDGTDEDAYEEVLEEGEIAGEEEEQQEVDEWNEVRDGENTLDEQEQRYVRADLVRIDRAVSPQHYPASRLHHLDISSYSVM